jgi:hypothetical protein
MKSSHTTHAVGKHNAAAVFYIYQIFAGTGIVNEDSTDLFAVHERIDDNSNTDLKFSGRSGNI